LGYPKFNIPRPAAVAQIANWQRQQAEDHKENYAKMDDQHKVSCQTQPRLLTQ